MERKEKEFNKKSNKRKKRKPFSKTAASIAVMISLVLSNIALGDVPACISRIQKALKNPKKYESVFTEQQFINKLEDYKNNPLSCCNLIIEGYSVVKDSTQKQFYFDKFLKDCKNLRPSMAFSLVCEFIEKNYKYVNDEQMKYLLTDAITYGKKAKDEISELDTGQEMVQSYKEGIEHLQKMLSKLMDYPN